ncbi:response regulator transcription factor [Psychrosphaera aquimarina]|uniref:Response regulator transcription factor n=1 Tax=Psychrosphaera aquimarina TaxID=2044854 RepID=A0ABU3R1C0_9GAMM|nr:response regulator transcription factor [Psychrosphaera aquimarina]MDU0113449.1 response regulator transcription factor [Psychrosphaera aquimarina]
MANILVVEDDFDIAKGIGEYLEIFDHELDFAYTGRQALSMISDNDYDLVLLDINLPHISGYDLCQSLLIEGLASLPVIMMSANQSEADILKGFESGAWDYLKKPFSYAELNARMTVALSKVKVTQSTGIQVKGFKLDIKAHLLTDNKGRSLQLHSIGYTLVKLMMESSPHPVASSTLIDTLWPDELPQSNPLRANIYSLRKQIKDTFQQDIIHNVKGVGYKFDVEI